MNEPYNRSSVFCLSNETHSPILHICGCSISNKTNFCRFRSLNGHIEPLQLYFSPRLNQIYNRKMK